MNIIKRSYDYVCEHVTLEMVKLGVIMFAVVMLVASQSYATDTVDFSTVVSTILGYLGAAFTAAGTLLALIYGAPLAWRFIKKFK